MSKQPPTCMEEPGKVRRGAQRFEIEVEREYQDGLRRMEEEPRSSIGSMEHLERERLSRWLAVEPRVVQERVVPEVDQTSFHEETWRILNEVDVADVAAGAFAAATGGIAADDRSYLGTASQLQSSMINLDSRHIEVDRGIPYCKELRGVVDNGACLGSFP
jgi:hypothetical protein